MRSLARGVQGARSMPRLPRERRPKTAARERIRGMLAARLDPREQALLEARFGWLDGRARTLRELGRDHTVSVERVRQLLMRAGAKLATTYGLNALPRGIADDLRSLGAGVAAADVRHDERDPSLLTLPLPTSIRVKALIRSGVRTIAEFQAADPEDLGRRRNVGPKTIDSIRAAIEEAQ